MRHRRKAATHRVFWECLNRTFAADVPGWRNAVDLCEWLRGRGRAAWVRAI